jgi:hypothetical protein
MSIFRESLPIGLRLGSSPVLVAASILLIGRLATADDFLDKLDDNLKFGTDNGAIAGKITGSLDLEEYYVQQPSPGLVYTDHSFLFSPRLTLNLDLQIGPQIYVFAQARADRGFDASAEDDGEIRGEQYAVRYSPWEDGRFNLQVGKSATVVGTWSHRDDSWTNPFVTAPLPYENQTAVWDVAAAPRGTVLHSWTMTSKDMRLPIIWEGSYTSGASIFGTIGKFDYAMEIKNAAVAARPESWSVTSVGFANPAYGGRLGFRPNESWNLGVSSSVGTYLKSEADGTLPPGEGLDDYREILIGEDASWAWHHWQVWAECYETRFQIPTVGDADTVAYYIEAKYKFSPEFSAALRWNQQLFNTVPDGFGGETPWGSNVRRIDAALTYRFSPHMQAKVQYSFIDQDAPVDTQQNFVAAQFTVRF